MSYEVMLCYVRLCLCIYTNYMVLNSYSLTHHFIECKTSHCKSSHNVVCILLYYIISFNFLDNEPSIIIVIIIDYQTLAYIKTIDSISGTIIQPMTVCNQDCK